MRYRLRTLLIILALGPIVLAIWYWQAHAHVTYWKTRKLIEWTPPENNPADVIIEPVLFGMSAATILNLALVAGVVASITVVGLRRRAIKPR